MSSKVHVQAFDNTIVSIARSLYRLPEDADWAVMELGMSEQGTIAPMATLVRPHCAIVTTVGLDHYRNHRSREAIAMEKGQLVEAVEPCGVAILNADDPHVLGMRRRTKQRVVTFGQNAQSDYRVSDISAGLHQGLSLTLHTPHGALPISNRFTGEHFWVPTAAAAVCAVEMGLGFDLIQRSIATFIPHWDRCHPMKVPGGPTFLIDTHKAPLYSLELAFKPMEQVSSRRRIVIGQLADFAGSSKMAARKALRMAEKYADELIFVGHSANRLGLSEGELATGRYSLFETVKDLADYLKATSSEDDVILLKSANVLHLERAALAWNHTIRCWKERCGILGSCLDCGWYGLSYSLHRGRLTKRVCQRIASSRSLQDENAN